MGLLNWLTGPTPEPAPEPLPIYDVETALRYVRASGYVVLPHDFLAGGDVMAHIGPFDLVRRDGPYRIIPADTALCPPGTRPVPIAARILPPGYVAKRERPPEFATYTPMWTTGEPRTVVGIMGDELTYRTAVGERTVKVGTFNDWRRDVGAVVG